ncbi:lasso peptide biosynthesis PqqD family chaperone [Halobacillus sp. BBL2006]|uniref:lasso peptide biosynthesis PqqD family chaperone n=1 Tax=Halobacillus sp. BBL2006 TaxID=1543706 RepID=UPI000543583D|nr:lasso peptide biosynthesis PqqD family chaperone [Halobacillus sp. BBL2006]KHE69229.1 metallophosphoesterase [Halobacillus sp. BBL2006]
MSQTLVSTQWVSQKEGNIVSDMNGERVMLSIENGKYYNLGELGGEIWDLIEEPIPINQVIERLLYQYEVERNVCEVQVQNFLNQLYNENLIAIEEKTSS